MASARALAASTAPMSAPSFPEGRHSSRAASIMGHSASWASGSTMSRHPSSWGSESMKSAQALTAAAPAAALEQSSVTCSSILSSRASGSRANTPDPLARSIERLPPCRPLLWWWQYTTAQPSASATLSNWLQNAAIWSAEFSSPVITL